MTTLVALLLGAIFSLDYLTIKLGLLSRYAILVPEVITLLLALVIVSRSLIFRRWEQPAKYAWTFVALVLVCMIGVVAEAVDPGPLVSGLRSYFKFLPLFLLPAVYNFSERQIKVLLAIFLFIAILQVPLAFFQRFVQFAARMHTGDPVTGTVSTSNSLTMILCVAIALVMTLYVHRKLALSVALLLFFFLAAPTAINETKATLILLPVATLGPFFLARGISAKWRKVLPVLMMCAVGLVAFGAVYNVLMENRWWGGAAIGEFIAAGHWEWYLYRGVEVGSRPDAIGRIDSVLVPLAVLSENWMQLLFGLGIGNVSPSFLPGMEGAYFEMYKPYGLGMTTIGNYLWEIGIVGTAIYLMLFILSWRDTRDYARSGDDMSWLGTWWSVCIIVFTFGLMYKSIFDFNELGYMFFFWSGVLASRFWRVRQPAKEELDSRSSLPLQLAGKGV